MSLIAVLHQLHVGIPKNAPPAGDAAVATGKWSVLAVWQKEPHENENMSFEQKVVLVDPSGRGRWESFTSFQIPKTQHRIIGNILGFPVEPQGTYTLRVSVRQQGDSDWREVLSYPIGMVHDISEASHAQKQENRTETRTQ